MCLWGDVADVSERFGVAGVQSVRELVAGWCGALIFFVGGGADAKTGASRRAATAMPTFSDGVHAATLADAAATRRRMALGCCFVGRVASVCYCPL